LSISLGAVYSECQLSFPVLFAEADTVLYSVKSKGKNGYRLIKHLEEI
jgi:GGDEF domain-containing protein